MNAGIRLSLALLALPQTLAAQSFLEQFSYEHLQFTGIGVEGGVLVSDRLTREVTGAVRVDYGWIAPRVRVLLGASYFKADFQEPEVTRFENQLCRILTPTGGCTIDIGSIEWSDWEADIDLQYVVGMAQRVSGYFGMGVGVHLMNGSGDAIAGTFVEDALDRVDLGINLSLGTQLQLVPSFFLTMDVRGGLATELRTAAARAGFMYRMSR